MKTKHPQLTYQGRAVTYRQASKLSGVPLTTIMGRHYAGQSEEEIYRRDPPARAAPNRRYIEIDGQRLTIEEIAAIAGISVWTVHARLQANKTGQDLIAPPQRCQAGSAVDSWVRTIDLPWEADLFAQHTVRDHPEGMTLAEVAALMNVSKERVRQIEEQALSKLRQIPGAKRLLQEALLRASLRREDTMPSSGFEGEECAA
jgi:hypothetical protein